MSDARHSHRVRIHLDEVLDRRGMTLADLSRQVDITPANLYKLKNAHARAIRFSTLTAICDVLACQPGDLMSVEEPDPGSLPLARRLARA